MSWIEIIPPAAATGTLDRAYRRLSGHGDRVDNILQIHSLRPHTLDGHMALYRSVLHHSGNRLSPVLAEAIGILVSRINVCDYCVAHHESGLRRAAKNPDEAEVRLAALAGDGPAGGFDGPERAALAYAEKLTKTPAAVTREDVDALRAAGWSDGEILEINQVAAYFAYVNRTAQGLGVVLEEQHPDK